MTDKQMERYYEENDLNNIETLIDEHESEIKETTSETSEQDPGQKKSNGILKEVLLWVRDLAITVGIVLLILTFVGETTSIIGASMEPHIHDGDRFIINKLSYRFSEPERFDIVVFPYDEEFNYIKRIIGLPGEEINLVRAEDGTYDIYINDLLLNETYGIEEIIRPGNQVYPYIIPEDSYFVMGDNRNDSSDSRYIEVGPVKEDIIIGKTWIRIWPLSTFGGVE